MIVSGLCGAFGCHSVTISSNCRSMSVSEHCCCNFITIEPNPFDSSELSRPSRILRWIRQHSFVIAVHFGQIGAPSSMMSDENGNWVDFKVHACSMLG